MILLSNSIIYIIFGILLQFLVEVRSQTVSIREAHTATFINNKLYILGGAAPPDDNISPAQTFLYLDFSVPFNTNELKWNDLSTITNNIVPPHVFATAAKGGENNNTLILYGGSTISSKPMEIVYTFDTQNNLWNVPKLTGTPAIGKRGLTAVAGYNGLIYLFGGSTFTTVANDMFVLDSINLSWKKVSSINAPVPRVQYGAVFLPNQNSIIYMGGFNGGTSTTFTLDEVYLYDITNDVWTTKATNGLKPTARLAFSSVLGLDGQRVIIFGGQGDMLPETSLYVLDSSSFTWFIPKVTGKIPARREFHKSVVIGKYMVVTFGNGYQQGVESDILLLDISNNDEYTWVSSLSSPVPSPTPSTTTSSAQSTGIPPLPPQYTNPTNNTGAIVGAVIGSLIGGILLTVGSFFLYKRYKNTRELNHAIPTPGESNQYPPKIIQIPRENTTYYQGQQVPIQPTYTTYNRGQEAIIPVYENTRYYA